MLSLKQIGSMCKKYRKEVLHMTQYKVADLTGYSRANVANFEAGRSGSISLFAFYFEMGLTYNYLYNINAMKGDNNKCLDNLKNQ